MAQSEINNIVWKACDSLRGSVDPNEYKDYVLVMLFVKYLSDVWNDKKAAYQAKYGGDEERGNARPRPMQRPCWPQVFIHKMTRLASVCDAMRGVVQSLTGKKHIESQRLPHVTHRVADAREQWRSFEVLEHLGPTFLCA